MLKSKISSIDVTVGGYVQRIRTAQRRTISSCARETGLTEAQFKEAEAGQKRFRAVELFELSKIFGVPIATFFQSVDPPEPSRSHNPTVSKRCGFGQ